MVHTKNQIKVTAKIGIIPLSIILLAGVFVIPTIQIVVHAVTAADTNPLINDIAQQITSGSGVDMNPILQLLEQMTIQVRDIAGEAMATETINLIALEVSSNSQSDISLSLFDLALLQDDIITVNKVMQDIAQQISQGATVPEIIAKVIFPAVVDMQNANQIVTQTSQNVIAGHNDNLGQIIESSFIVCPSEQQYFNYFSQQCIHNQGRIFYTDNKCKNLGITDIAAMTEDGINMHAYDIADTVQTVQMRGTGEGIGSLTHTNLNTQNIICNIDNNWQYKQNEPQDNNFVRAVSIHGIDLGHVEKVVRQMILKIDIKGGQYSSQRSLTQVADKIAEDPKGPASQSIFKLSQHQASGKTEVVNEAITKVTEEVIIGGDIADELANENAFIEPPEPYLSSCEVDPTAEGCVDLDPCEVDPTAEGCVDLDPCEVDPTAEGCVDLDPCEVDPTAEGCVDLDPCEVDPTAEGCVDSPSGPAEVEEEEVEEEEVEEEEVEEEEVEEATEEESESEDAGDY
jgi:hypothetical protein